MAEDPHPGMIVGGRYELVELAGRGGMADVWRGRVRGDSGFTREVAVKQMHASLAVQPQYVAMFVEEARVGSLLHSPHVAEVHDFVAESGNYYMILEWIDGLDLGTWIRWHASRNEPTPWELVGAVGVGVLRGLATAHERVGADGRPAPIVHRDVSPHNVLLTARGMVKLIDFGLTLTSDRARETTEPGVVKGKMSYLAPEIVAGGRPLPASDQFACGSVLWEALVGKKLFDGATDYETYCRLREVVVPPIKTTRGDVPSPFVSIIQRALAKNVADRFPSTREMARQVSGALKKVQLRKDLHAMLSQSVADARKALGVGPVRHGDPSQITPIAEVSADDIPRLERLPKPDEKPRGLRHRLPAFFSRWRS